MVWAAERGLKALTRCADLNATMESGSIIIIVKTFNIIIISTIFIIIIIISTIIILSENKIFGFGQWAVGG